MMKRKLLLLALMATLNLNAQCWRFFDPGYNHSTAINTDGRLRTIGYNGYGQIGDGTNTERHVFTMAGNDPTWTVVSGGGNHTLAVRVDGTLWAWGRNVQGELGIGTTGNRNVPTQVGTATDWIKVWAGAFHSFAQKADGTLWGWGLNYSNQLGNPSAGGNTPVQINAETDWLDIFPGAVFTAAIKTDGTLWAWGNISGGGTTPTKIGMDTDWVKGSGGDLHAMAIKSDGSLWGFGSNADNQIGEPNPDPNGNIIRRVGNANDWMDVAAGDAHSIGLKTDGTMWAWGDGGYGALGLGNVTDHPTPVQVGTATDWLSVKTHGSHSMALKTNGQLFSWGENTYGQLGVVYPNGNMPSVSPCPGLLEMDEMVSVHFEVYPNPVRDVLYISNDENTPLSFITITDATGKKIMHLSGNQSQINVSELAQGMYIVQIKTADQVSMHKLIKS